MKSAWWKDAADEAHVESLTRASIERVIDKKAAEAREALSRERLRTQELSKRPVKLSRMRPISYYAKMLGFAPDTIRCWIKERALQAEYIRGAYRIAESDMAEFIRKERLKHG